MAPRVAGKEIEKIPLRDECDKRTARGKMREIRDRRLNAADMHRHARHFVVRQLEKILKDSFAGHGVPYGKEAIIACIAGLEITIPTIPMRYAQESQATLLLLYRLLDEAETGLVQSPIQV